MIRITICLRAPVVACSEFMGEIDEVMAVTQRPFEVIEGESLCHAILRFESGLVGSYQATVLSKRARMAHSEEPFFRLIGQEGDIVIAGTALHGQGSVKLFTNEHPEGIEMMDTAEGAPLGYMDSFGPQLENLVRARTQSLSLACRQLSCVP
jgi:predicted dehydrogenase